MSDGHTLTQSDIHNSYGSANCIRFEGIISAFPTNGKAPLCFLFICRQIYEKILISLLTLIDFLKNKRSLGVIQSVANSLRSE